MSLHRKPMSPALLAVVLLSACGGGGGGNAGNGGSAVSASPVAPAAVATPAPTVPPPSPATPAPTPNADGNQGTPTLETPASSTLVTTPAPATTPAPGTNPAPESLATQSPASTPAPGQVAGASNGNAEATATQQVTETVSTNNTTSSSQGNAADSVNTVAGNVPTTQPSAAAKPATDQAIGKQPPVLVPGKYLRGDALMTMLSSKTPIPEIYETAQNIQGADENGYVRDENGKIIRFDDGIDWKFFGTKDPRPTDDRLNPDGTRDENTAAIKAGSYTTPNFYATINDDEDLPAGIHQYRPPQGNYAIAIYSTLSSPRELEDFTDITATIYANQNENTATLDENLVLTTYRRLPEIIAPSKSRTLIASSKKTIFANDQIPEGQAIHSWMSKAGQAKLYWKSAEANNTIDLCLETTIESTHRTHCTIWDIQDNWDYGHRFMKGGTYIEDELMTPGGNKLVRRWIETGNGYDPRIE